MARVLLSGSVVDLQLKLTTLPPIKMSTCEHIVPAAVNLFSIWLPARLAEQGERKMTFDTWNVAVLNEKKEQNDN